MKSPFSVRHPRPTWAVVGSIVLSLVAVASALAATLDDFGYNRRRVNGVEARGHRPLLVILADYAGTPRPFPSDILARIETQVFSLLSTQSVSGYFLENSNGRFFWNRAGVVGPLAFSAAQRQDGNDPRIMATVVLAAMRSGQFNFADYDANGDGIVTSDELGILIVSNKSADGQWGVMRWANPDGVNSPYLLQVPEQSVRLRCQVSAADHTASFTTTAHELSHQLQTLDLYGNGSLNSDLTLMDATIEGLIPDAKTYHLDPWHKMHLGWAEPRIFSFRSGGTANLPAPQFIQPDAPIILFDPVLGVSEFFMLEFRTRRRPNGGLYDTGVAGTGMCLWQIRQDGDKNPTPIANVTAYAVIHQGSPSLSFGGNGVWGGGTTTPTLRRLDGTVLPLRIAVRPFNPDDGSITVEWFWNEGTWVDFNYGGFFEFGTFDFPFNTLAEGIAAVPWDGTLWIKPGTTPETMTIAKRMRIEAFGGVVTIGR